MYLHHQFKLKKYLKWLVRGGVSLVAALVVTPAIASLTFEDKGIRRQGDKDLSSRSISPDLTLSLAERSYASSPLVIRQGSLDRVLGRGKIAVVDPILVRSPHGDTTSSISQNLLDQPLEEGRRLYRSGRFAEAVALWQGAAQAYETQGDRGSQVLVSSYLSLAYQELAQWEAAKGAIEQSLNLLKSTSDAEAILWAQTLNTQAQLFLATGQAEAALETWEEAQEFYDRAGDAMGSLGSQINQAQALQSLGFYRRSHEGLEAINTQLETTPDSDLKLAGLRSLGATFYAIGDLELSREVLQQSLAIAEQMGVTSETSAILLSLGNTTKALGDPEEALDYFQQAQQATYNPLEQLDAQLNQLFLLVELERWPEATTLAGQIQQQLAGLSPSRTTIFGAVNLAGSVLKMGDREGTLTSEELNQILAGAVRSAHSLQDSQAEAYALSKWGQLYARNGQLPTAINLTQQSLGIAQSLQSAELAAQSALQLGRLQARKGERKEAIAAYSEAVSALQALRGDLVSVNAEVQFSFRESIEPVYRELVELLLAGNPSQENLILARESIENLQLAELDNFFREACLDAEPIQIDQIDPTAAAIYPIILSDRLAVITSVPGQPIHYHAVSLAKTEVENTIDEFLASLSPIYDESERLRLFGQIYDWLIQPIQTDGTLTGMETLIFVLDGKLRQLPMAALHDGEQYLVEQYNVALSQGLQLLELKSQPQEQISTIVGGLSEARQGFEALPGVAVEVDRINKELSASILLNQEFTETAFASQMNANPANVVHLATHGQFSSNAEDTFLLTWDDRINVKELDALLQSRQIARAGSLELLVLSACETAAGDERALLGLAGFAVRSGAQSTLATLWRVRDESTTFFVSEFYKHLKEPGTSKAEAMRKAQLALLADSNFSDPFFWAPFVLVGNWL